MKTPDGTRAQRAAFGLELRRAAARSRTACAEQAEPQRPSHELARIAGRTSQLARLLETLDQLASASHESARTSAEPFSLGEALATVLSEVEPQLQASGQRVVISLNRPVLRLRCDRQTVVAICATLVLHVACRARPGAWISVHASRCEERVRLVVGDLGLGPLRPGRRRRALDPIIGLPIVEAVVSGQRGSLAVGRGRGTVGALFVLHLPGDGPDDALERCVS